MKQDLKKATLYQLRRENFKLPNYQQFCLKVKGLISVALPDITCEFVDVEDQKAEINDKKLDLDAVVSLDPMILAKYNLGISRLFGVSCPKSFIEVINRPGTPSLSAQVAEIPNVPLKLMDDDSITNSTINAAKRLLGGRVQSVVLLSKPQFRLDISDCRDFLLGSPYGGLAVQLPNGQYARAPYALPYVFPSDRCTTPTKMDYELSVKIWELNLSYYGDLCAMLVKDADKPTVNLLLYIGFSPEHPLKYVCLWHLIHLTKNGLA